jgi:hypothetical protein
MKPIALALLLLLTLQACEPQPQTAEDVIDRAYHAAGCHLAEQALIRFDFRDRSYSVERKDGLFDMRRYTYVSDDTVIMDKYHNYGFQRFLNDSMVSIPDSMAAKYQASVNSVIYFFSLPHGLKDPAVNAERLEQTDINGESYYKIKVWFDEAGGGEDHEDVFIYWIHAQTYTVDYLAYQYETDGGGMRFRAAKNPRTIEGIRVVDYINYKPVDASVPLETLDSLFEADQLEVLSQIENDNVTISLIKG